MFVEFKSIFDRDAAKEPEYQDYPVKTLSSDSNNFQKLDCWGAPSLSSPNVIYVNHYIYIHKEHQTT